MEETIPESQIELPNSVTNDILHKMNVDTQQEASPYLAEKPPLNPVNRSLAPLEDSSKECNMHLLANAVDRVMYHPPISTTNANIGSVANMAAEPSQQQHGIISALGRSSSSPFQPLAVMATYKDNSLPTTTSHTMNLGVGLIPAHNYPSSVQIPNSPMPSSNYLPSGSSHTIPPSVSSMHVTSSPMPYGVNSKYMTPSSMPLPSHIVHSASSSYGSGSIIESPSSSQYVIDTTTSSVFSPTAGTIHRPTISMPGITTMFQPSSSGLSKSPSSFARKDPPVWPSGNIVLPAETTAPAIVSNIPLPTSNPLYIPMSSLQSNVMMSSSSHQFQIPSSSVIFEHKPSTSSPSINTMLGVSSSFESRANMIGPTSQLSISSVSTSKKANLCSSDSSSHNVTSVHQHLNTGENGPTSSAPTQNTLHSTTGYQGYTKPSVFSQPSSTMLGQGDAAGNCTSSMSESRQLSSTENNYPLSPSNSPSEPSSSELSSVQVPSSSFGSLGSTLTSELLNSGKSAFSDCVTTADRRDTVSGSTDSPIQPMSDCHLGSSKVVSDAASLTSHIANSPQEKTKITSASSSAADNASLQKVTSGSSSAADDTSLKKVTSGPSSAADNTSLKKVTSGSSSAADNTSLQKVTSGSSSAADNTSLQKVTSGSSSAADNTSLKKVTSGSSSAANISLQKVTSGSSSAADNTSLQKVTSGSSSAADITSLQKVTSGSSGKVTSASGDKVTSVSGNKVTNENNKADSDKVISTSGQPESDKGISTSGQPESDKGISTSGQPESDKGISTSGQPESDKGISTSGQPESDKGISTSGQPESDKGISTSGQPESDKGISTSGQPESDKGISTSGQPESDKGISTSGQPESDKGISTSGQPESDKGITTSGLPGEHNSSKFNDSFEAEQVTSGSGNLSTRTCVTSVASNASSEKNTSVPEKALPSSGHVTSSPEANKQSENNVTSGRKEQSVSGNSDSDHVTSGTNNVTFGQASLSSETNNGNTFSDCGNVTSGTNNVSSGSGIDNDSNSSNSRLANSSGETKKSSADCSNSVLESSSQITDLRRSNVCSSLIKSDPDSLSSSVSGNDANSSTSIQNSLHRKGKIKNFGLEDTNSPMKADSSSSSLKMKPITKNSVSKDDDSCTSTIADLDTNCLKTKPKNKKTGKKSETGMCDSKANSTISDSALSQIQKDADDADPALKKTKTVKIPENKDNLVRKKGTEVKVEVKVEMTETSDFPSPHAYSAEVHVKEGANKKFSPGKKSVKCADTSTDAGPGEMSPGKCQKRKRSQSPVSSSLAEPRRSSRQPKSKFNVLDLVGVDINIDYSMEDEKTPIKESTHSPAVAVDSSFSSNISEEVMVEVTDQEMEDMYNKSFDSNRKFKEQIDMEKIIAPFEQGWRREVVIRGVYAEFTKGGKPKRVPADVYYYAPDRRKLRSMVQIVNYLREMQCNLTSENFNFMRRSIYKAPFEVVRNASKRCLGAKPKTPKGSPKGLEKTEVGMDLARCEDGCNTAEEEEEINASIEPEFELALAATALTVQHIVPPHWASNSGEGKVKGIKTEPMIKMEIENRKTEGASEQQVLALQTLGKHPLENSNSSGKKPKKTKSVARKSTSQLPKSLSLSDVITNAEPFQPCSLSCPGLVGIPPTLHCDICMCLFHIACVNLKDNEVPKVFTCKNCAKDERLVRNKMTVKTVAITTATATITATPPAIMVTTTTASSSSSSPTTTTSIIASKAIPTSLISITSLNSSPTSNIVNTITDNRASESEKKANKVASKPSVIQLSSSKEISVVTHLPRKHGNTTRQVVVVNTPLSMLNGTPGRVISPIEILAGNHSREVNAIPLTPDSSDHVTCSTPNISNSVRPSIIPSRIKASKNANPSSSLFAKKSSSFSQSSPSVLPLLPKDNTSVIAAAASSSYNVSIKNNSVTTTTTPFTTPAAASTSTTTTSTVTTTTTTTTSSSSSTNLTTNTTMATTTSTNATTSASIDCTKDLTLKNSMSLAPESPIIVSPSKLLAPPSHPLTPVTTSSSSIKMETLSSSSSSSSSPSSSLSSYAHSGSGVNSVVGLQVSNTLLGSESYPRSGQLLTLPSAVAKRLNPSLPLALRINNMQLLIPPSRCINTAEGLKVFLPPKTFSVPSGSTTTMNITFSSGSMSADNAKDLSLSMLSKDKSMSLDMCDQVVDLSKTAETSKTVLKVTERRNKMKNYLCPFKTLYTGYNTMIQIFSYLSAGDLVRCSLVCRTWRRLATQSSLWNAVHLENTRISDWARATQFFSRYLVEELSLRGMQYEDDWNRVWHQLTPVLEQLTTLKRLYFDHVPALMLYTVCQKLPQLEDLGANMISDFTNEQQWTTPTKIDLAKFCNLKNLRKLQLRGTGGLASSFSSGISEMVTLKYLHHLSLTSMKSVGDHDLDYLGELKGLKVLEIGDCTNWTSETYFQLGKLVNLENLRLERGGEIPDVGLADALFNLKSLLQLELITFVIADTLHAALNQMKNLRKFVIWPDTTQQAALVNSNTFVTVIKLPTLKQLEWGVAQNKNSSIILNEPRSVTTASNNIMGSDKDLGDNMALIPFLSPDAQALASQTPNNNGQMLASSSEKFTEYIGMRQLGEKLKCLLTNTQVTVFRTLDDTSCVSSW